MIDRACISLNHRCNLQCSYCHLMNKETSISDELYEFLPDEVIGIVDSIADYCHGNGIVRFKLGIVGSGEPMLSYQSMQAIVLEAKQYGMLFDLYTITNGVGLTDEQVEFFYAYRDIIELNISLDGYEELHNALRWGYRQTTDAIALYEGLFGIKPQINATVTRKSIENADKLTEFFTANGFNRINFSILINAGDPTLEISRKEYEDFLLICSNKGITMRQTRKGMEHTHDCEMYGAICGVGHTNIFITRKGVYPCGRFFGLEEYKLAKYNATLTNIETSFNRLQPKPNGYCYYEAVVGGNK